MAKKLHLGIVWLCSIKPHAPIRRRASALYIGPEVLELIYAQSEKVAFQYIFPVLFRPEFQHMFLLGCYALLVIGSQYFFH